MSDRPEVSRSGGGGARLIDIGDERMLGQCPDGRRIWMRGPGVPGDEVLFEPEGKGGRILRVLEPALERVEPACPHFGVCPGCQLQPLPADRQRELKAGKITETLRRLGGFDGLEFRGGVSGDAAYGTRNKLDFTVEGPDLGYRAPEGLVPVRTCPVGDPALTAWIPRLRDWLARHPDHGLHRILLRTGSDRSRVLILLRGNLPDPCREDFLALAAEEPAAAGVAIQADWKQPWRTLAGEGCVGFRLAGVEHRVAYDGFFQIHDRLAERLVGTALEWLGAANGRTLLDLFCGCGSFTLPARDAGFTVAGVDSRPPRQGPFQRSDLRKGLPKDILSRSWDVVLTDPPRAGMEKRLVQQLRDRVRPERFLHVSCNPATLARDLKRFCADGRYRPGRIQGFDLFPQTTHVETLVELLRV